MLTQIGAVAMGTRICAQLRPGAGKAEWGFSREGGGFLLYRGDWRKKREPRASSLAVLTASAKGDPRGTECGRSSPPGDSSLCALGPCPLHREVWDPHPSPSAAQLPPTLSSWSLVRKMNCPEGSMVLYPECLGPGVFWNSEFRAFRKGIWHVRVYCVTPSVGFRAASRNQTHECFWGKAQECAHT